MTGVQVEALPAEGLVITKRGRPVARVMPVADTDADLIGSMRGRLKIRGSILRSPVSSSGLRCGRSTGRCVGKAYKWISEVIRPIS